MKHDIRRYIDYIKSSFGTLFFRGLSLVSKFFLIMFIGKYLPTEDLGVFGLFFATVTIAHYVVGFDFYTYTTRELIAGEPAGRARLIRDQFVFHGIGYVLAAPVLLTAFITGSIPMEYAPWVYLIFIFGHLSHELFRILITLQRQVFATITLFVRDGLWIYIILVLWMGGFDELKNLTTVWAGWCIGSLLSMILSLIYLGKLNLGTFFHVAVDWKWIKKGIGVSLFFFSSTVAYKIVEFSNRYFLDYYSSKTEVGIFTFYYNIANLVNVVVYTAVIMFYFPKLVELHNNRETDKYRSSLKEFSILVVLVSLGCGLFAIVLIDPLLRIMNKAEFAPAVMIFYVLLLSNIVLNISNIPHYMLYVTKKDRLIMYTTVGGALINIVLNFLLIPRFGLKGAALASLLSFVCILLSKYACVRRVDDGVAVI